MCTKQDAPANHRRYCATRDSQNEYRDFLKGKFCAVLQANNVSLYTIIKSRDSRKG
jgi:hypothetical protein